MVMRILSVVLVGLVGLAPLRAIAQESDAPDAPAQPALVPQPAETAREPEQPAADLPTPSAIIDRYIEAIGGRERYFAQTNRILEGTSMTKPGSAFSLITIWQSRDNRLRLRSEKPGATWLDLHFADDAAWMIDGRGRISLLGGAVLLDMADSADFYAYADPDKRYESLTTIGVEPFEDRLAYKVMCRTIYHKDEALYFDTKTGLLLGLETTQATNEGIKPITVLLQDYKPYGGILFPTRIIQRGQDGTTTFQFSKIRVDVEDFVAIEMPEVVARRVEEIRQQKESSADNPPADASGG